MTVRATRLPPMLEFSIVLGMTYGLMLLPALWRAAASNVLAVLSILPLGILFSAFHWKTRRLWPAVVAHLILDGLALLRFAV